MKKVELVIIGGGPAGMAAACGAYEQGLRDILILERDYELGGILNQCIHNGFGLHYFKKEYAGPEYAQMWIEDMNQKGIKRKLNTMVLDVSKDKIVEYVNPEEGYQKIQAHAVILAMGCRERTRGAINIPGFRPAGIWSAGTAQRYVNIEDHTIGRKVFILGSGDIGLIMARRMKLEGAEVLGVAEIMPISSGLPRNIQQCLRDFDIPLYLSHNITNIKGRDRVEEIEISQVDENFKPIAGTQKRFECDTLLLSVGLIPENHLSIGAGVELDPGTKGAIVNESNMTNVQGIYSCGNVLHVHDIVDYVSEEALLTGRRAAQALMHLSSYTGDVKTSHSEEIGYLIPQMIQSRRKKEQLQCFFRVRRPMENREIVVLINDQEYKRIKRRKMIPAEMERVQISFEDGMVVKSFRIEIEEAK